jgi:hypothetical protein
MQGGAERQPLGLAAHRILYLARGMEKFRSWVHAMILLILGSGASGLDPGQEHHLLAMVAGADEARRAGAPDGRQGQAVPVHSRGELTQLASTMPRQSSGVTWELLALGAHWASNIVRDPPSLRYVLQNFLDRDRVIFRFARYKHGFGTQQCAWTCGAVSTTGLPVTVIPMQPDPDMKCPGDDANFMSDTLSLCCTSTFDPSEVGVFSATLLLLLLLLLLLPAACCGPCCLLPAACDARVFRLTHTLTHTHAAGKHRVGLPADLPGEVGFGV